MVSPVEKRIWRERVTATFTLSHNSPQYADMVLDVWLAIGYLANGNFDRWNEAGRQIGRLAPYTKVPMALSPEVVDARWGINPIYENTVLDLLLYVVEAETGRVLAAWRMPQALRIPVGVFPPPPLPEE